MRKGVLATKDALASFLKRSKMRFFGFFLVSFFCLPVFQNKGINNESCLLRLLITKAWCLLRLYFEMNTASFASFCVTIAYFISTKAV